MSLETDLLKLYINLRKSQIDGYLRIDSREAAMDRFGICTNKEKDPGYETTRAVRDYLIARGKVCLCGDDFEGHPEAFAGQIDCLLVLGGDGTFIHTARQYAPFDLPMLGINLGTLGYLTSVEKDSVYECLDALIADQYTVKTRMMLTGSVSENGHIVKTSEAVNDIIVNRSGFSRIVELRLYINGDLVNAYAADGLIVSTPTGSTGYNLSAGGPIIYPETELMAITPICPHSLSARSIVVSGREKIEIEVGRRSKTEEAEALVTYDGQVIRALKTGDRVEIRQAEHTVKLISINNRSFYQVLRDKIGNV